MPTLASRMGHQMGFNNGPSASKIDFRDLERDGKWLPESVSVSMIDDFTLDFITSSITSKYLRLKNQRAYPSTSSGAGTYATIRPFTAHRFSTFGVCASRVPHSVPITDFPCPQKSLFGGMALPTPESKYVADDLQITQVSKKSSAGRLPSDMLERSYCTLGQTATLAYGAGNQDISIAAFIVCASAVSVLDTCTSPRATHTAT
ncbi:hypothetical protein B0H11DRAFT_2299930 [Mycena galericulata]|nr:hypothetical protein B0H11DRAFT_2299930 [Mycena galericulata]